MIVMKKTCFLMIVIKRTEAKNIQHEAKNVQHI